MSVQILQHQVPDLLLSVEVAWGADLTAGYATWVWTDITEDVRVKDGVHLRHGRSDEATVAQPASCTVTLDNSAGAYSLGGQSPNWPYVRANVPVRVVLAGSSIATSRTLFVGFADAWQPSWNQAATVAEVKLTASGILRRLAQQDAPVRSSLRRSVDDQTNVVAHWPMEEGRKATVAQSAIEGHQPLQIAGEVQFGGDTDTFEAALQTAVVKNGSITAEVPAYINTDEWQVRVLMGFPDAPLTDLVVLMRVHFAPGESTAPKYAELVYGTTLGGGMKLVVYDNAGTQRINTGFLTTEFDGAEARVYVEAIRDGLGQIEFRIGTQDQRYPSGFGSVPILYPLAPANLGIVTRVELFPDRNVSDVSVGHLVVQDEIVTGGTDRDALMAYDGELTYLRFYRLCDENGITRVAYGDGSASVDDTLTDKMGAQRPKTLLALLRDTEAVDGGFISDGINNDGLSFFMRRVRESRPVSMTVTASQLSSPLQPVDDDADRLNRCSARREDGGEATFEDVTGPYGTASIGTYDASVTLNTYTDDSLPYQASWRVHKGTIGGYRYPSVDLDFASTPELIFYWLTLIERGPGRRIDIVNPELVAVGHPAGTISLEVQGYEQIITPFSWTVSINCAPFEPWRVALVADETGDTRDTIGRVDTDGSTLNSSALTGATSLSVASTGALWTTDADDFPFVVDVGGIPLEVTTISGSTSPQTFTVEAAPRALPAGLPVSIARPTYLGL